MLPMSEIEIESRATEWSDLPIELQSMIVELCDYSTRCRLRATSFSLKHLADTAKLFIPSVKIREKRNEVVQLTFTFSSGAEEYVLNYYSLEWGQTCIKQRGKQDVIVDEKDPGEATLDLFKRCCVQVQKILWHRDGDSGLGCTILQRCRPELLKDIKVQEYCNFEVILFEVINVKAFKNLESLQIFGQIDAVDEDVLALNASKIHLESHIFSGKLVNELVKKWARENKKESFCLLKGGNFDELTTTGFEPIPSLEGEPISAYRMPLPDNSVIYLKRGPKAVSLEIKNQPVSDDSPMDRQRERCLRTTADCCCDPNFAPYEDGDDSEYDNYSDRDSDYENEYGYGWRRYELDESDFDEYDFSNDEEDY
uniref:F-box domain-containing protein n=1 Tax=Caenorhabditis japonica TaxID=281687 RepID=A0A8R1I907_CAEJA